MPDTATNVHILKVFTDPDGNHGDLASVVIDEGRHIPDTERQAIARELNTGETIFINNLAEANISVMHPQGEIGFAGVGVLGTAWLLTKLRSKPTDKLHTRDGEIIVWQEGKLTWARASISIMPPWSHKRLDSPEAVEQIELEDTKTMEHTMFWAWVDEAKGLIRARTFAADWDIPEAEGNGSGSLALAAKLKWQIEIRHGKGAVVFAKPASDDCADIGGRVAEVDTIET
jgi:predicted PhzF superfamily epimerase YddE/YHI9